MAWPTGFILMFCVMRKRPESHRQGGAMTRSLIFIDILQFLALFALALLPLDSASDEPRAHDTVFVQGGVYTLLQDSAAGNRGAGGAQVGVFAIDRYEVSNQQYDECATAKACPKKRMPEAGDLDSTFFDAFDRRRLLDALINPLSPATAVSFSDAARYCTWRGGRLPTVSEWQWAASGRGSDVRYSWGNQPPTCQRLNSAFYNEDGTDSHYTSCYNGPLPADARLDDVTPQGVYHMMGNAQELTSTVIDVLREGRGLVSSAMVKGSAWRWNPVAINDSPVFADSIPVGDTRGALSVGFRCVYPCGAAAGVERALAIRQNCLPDSPTGADAAVRQRNP